MNTDATIPTSQTQFPITVDLRLNSSDKTKAKAFADVTIALGSAGVVKVSGFSIFHDDNGAARVVPPARKGTSKYFEIVSLIGEIRQFVNAAVEAEYQRQNGR